MHDDDDSHADTNSPPSEPEAASAILPAHLVFMSYPPASQGGFEFLLASHFCHFCFTSGQIHPPYSHPLASHPSPQLLLHTFHLDIKFFAELVSLKMPIYSDCSDTMESCCYNHTLPTMLTKQCNLQTCLHLSRSLT
jgi:hypothetical protein